MYNYDHLYSLTWLFSSGDVTLSAGVGSGDLFSKRRLMKMYRSLFSTFSSSSFAYHEVIQELLLFYTHLTKGFSAGLMQLRINIIEFNCFDPVKDAIR